MEDLGVENISNRVWIECGFSDASDGKETACNARDPGLILGSGRSPEEGNGNPTPVVLPGKFRGQRSLAGYSPWGFKELDTTEGRPLSLWLTECGLRSAPTPKGEYGTEQTPGPCRVQVTRPPEE